MTSPKNPISGLLTGVSLATLSFCLLGGRGTAVAAGTTIHGTGGSKTISTNFDYVNITGDFATVTNNATIRLRNTTRGVLRSQTIGSHTAVAVFVTTAATVD